MSNPLQYTYTFSPNTLIQSAQVNSNFNAIKTLINNGLSVDGGGTGAVTAAAGFNNLSPITTTGDLIYGSASNTSSRLPIGSANQVLKSVGGIPTWSTFSNNGINYFASNPDFESGATTGYSLISCVRTATFSNGSADITVSSATGMSVGLPIVVSITEGTALSPSAGTGPTAGSVISSVFYIVSIASNVITVATTRGGSAITWTVTGSGGTQWVRPLVPTTYTGGSAFNETLAASSTSPLRGTYSLLTTQHNAVTSLTNATITQASPAVCTTSGAHGLAVNQMLWFHDNSDTLPSPLALKTPYYVLTVPSSTTFTLSASVGGSAINTTTSGAGVHQFYADGCTAGQGWSFPFTIDSTDQAKVLQFSCDYNVSSVFSSADGITAPNVGGAGDSDKEFFAWDVTNSVLIPIQPQVITAKGSNNFAFKGTFQTNSNSTSYAILCFGSKAELNTTGYQLKLDNLICGPQSLAYASPVTDWVTFTPTGSWTANTTYTGYWRRIGDSMECDVTVATSGAPTSASLTINVPNATIDTNKLSSSATDGSVILGVATVLDGATANYPASVKYNSSTSVSIRVEAAGGTYSSDSTVTQAVPITFGASDKVHLRFLVPILGWGSSTLMSNDANTRVLSVYSNGVTPTGTLNGSWNNIIYGTLQKDTHSAYNTTTGVFTAPFSAFYNVEATIEVAGTYAVNNYAAVGYAKNGSTVLGLPEYAQVATLTRLNPKFVHQVFLSAGDTFAFQSNSNATGPSYTATFGSAFAISAISGPSAVAATESVNFMYGHAAATAVTSITTIAFDTKTKDSHNAVSSGVFTCPSSGMYHFDAVIAIKGATFALNDLVQVDLVQAGSASVTRSVKGYVAAAVTQYPVTLAAELNLLVGDTVQVKVTSARASSTLSGTVNENWFGGFLIK